MLGLISPLARVVSKVIDEVHTSDDERNKARLQFLKLEQEGRLGELQTQMSALIAEAKSDDPWTSRARPAFLYLMYAIVTMSFLGGILGVWFPEGMDRAAGNIQAMLGAIPESMWGLFGAGYLGYGGMRSFDKMKGRG